MLKLRLRRVDVAFQLAAKVQEAKTVEEGEKKEEKGEEEDEDGQVLRCHCNSPLFF